MTWQTFKKDNRYIYLTINTIAIEIYCAYIKTKPYLNFMNSKNSITCIHLLSFKERLHGNIKFPALTSIKFNSENTEYNKVDLMLICDLENWQQFKKDKKIKISGKMTCLALHATPLDIIEGFFEIYPWQGLGVENCYGQTFIFYNLTIRDQDGNFFYLKGIKTICPGFHLWRDTTTLNIYIYNQLEQLLFAGQVRIKFNEYIVDQIIGIRQNQKKPKFNKLVDCGKWLLYFFTFIAKIWLKSQVRFINIQLTKHS